MDIGFSHLSKYVNSARHFQKALEITADKKNEPV